MQKLLKTGLEQHEDIQKCSKMKDDTRMTRNDKSKRSILKEHEPNLVQANSETQLTDHTKQLGKHDKIRSSLVEIHTGNRVM